MSTRIEGHRAKETYPTPEERCALPWVLTGRNYALRLPELSKSLTALAQDPVGGATDPPLAFRKRTSVYPIAETWPRIKRRSRSRRSLTEPSMRRRRSPRRRSMIARISGTPLVAQSRCSKRARSDARTITRSSTPGNDPEGSVPSTRVRCRGQMPWLMLGSSRGSRSPMNEGTPSRSHHAQTTFIREAPDPAGLRARVTPRPPMLPETTHRTVISGRGTISGGAVTGAVSWPACGGHAFSWWCCSVSARPGARPVPPRAQRPARPPRRKGEPSPACSCPSW
jgi:hypothetical protein